MTRRTANLDLVPAEFIDLNADDASRLGLSSGDRVEVSSRHGTIVTRAHVTGEIASGQAFLAFHFPEVATNALTSDMTDDVTSCPEYKVIAVRLRPASGGSRVM